MNNSHLDWRSKRSLNHLSIHTMNYSTYSLPDTTKKAEMKNIYGIYDNKFEKAQNLDVKMEVESLSVNSWFIKSATRVFSGILRKFIRRTDSPDPSYYDCESRSDETSPCPSRWQFANTENKNIQAQDSGTYKDSSSEMNGDCVSVVAACEDKLNKVRQLITTKTVQTSPKCHAYRSKRRRKVFVEAGSVEESFEDAFSPEDFVSLANNSTIAYLVPLQCQKQEFCGIDSPKTKVRTGPVSVEIIMTPKETDMAPNQTDIPQEETMSPKASDTALKGIETIPLLPEKSLKESENTQGKLQLNLVSDGLPNIIEPKFVEDIKPEIEQPLISKTQETIASCESKMLQLHALLRRKNKNSLNLHDSGPESDKERTTQTKPKVIPIPKSQDKRFKNSNRTHDKRKKCTLKKVIQDDMLFADELTDDVSSVENSPSLNKLHESSTSNEEDYFDEIAGRFRKNSTTESEDSFQVVFADSPRSYRPSDCESEDSFIFFEDSPDSCYTSNDVFGDGSESESEYSDSDTEVSDSGCSADELKMPHSMSKTVGNLTDNSLYDDSEPVDQVDSAGRMCEEVSSQDLDLSETKSTSVMMNDDKKLIRKSLPPKKVHFSEKPPKVHVMRVWAFAARQARAGNWERHALDRERFKRRIADADMALSWVLKPQHRSRVMFQRFMPWWNAQKRQELAEKKQRQEEEKRKKEEEEMKAQEELEMKAQEELERNNDIKGNTDESDNLELNSGSEVKQDNVKHIENIEKDNNKSDKNVQEITDLETLDKINNENKVNTQIVNVNDSLKNSDKLEMCKDSDIIKDSLKIKDTNNDKVEELNQTNKRIDESFKKIELILTPSSQNYVIVPVDSKEDKVAIK